jgi:hypothetical protein
MAAGGSTPLLSHVVYSSTGKEGPRHHRVIGFSWVELAQFQSPLGTVQSNINTQTLLLFSMDIRKMIFVFPRHHAHFLSSEVTELHADHG